VTERSSGLQSRAAGLSPDSLVHVGERKMDRVRITVIDYDADNVFEKEVASVEECYRFRDTSTVTWINIDGIHDADVIGKLGGHFGLHPLVLESIMNTTQRPKMEDLGEAVYLVLKMTAVGPDCDIGAEQLSLLFGSNYVLTFQEEPGDVFDPIRERIRKGQGRLRKMGADYLAYALLDAVVTITSSWRRSATRSKPWKTSLSPIRTARRSATSTASRARCCSCARPSGPCATPSAGWSARRRP
jgi:magnesium transporter